jgi:hypothetical protein
VSKVVLSGGRLRRYGRPMGSVVILFYVVVPLVLAYVLYFVLRKAIAHGIRDARRAAAKEALLPSDTPGGH